MPMTPPLAPEEGASVGVFVCDDGMLLPDDLFDGEQAPDLDGDALRWVEQAGAWLPDWVVVPGSEGFPAVRTPSLVEGQPVEVTAAVYEWELAASRRMQAEAVEAAAMLACEAAFRASFEAEFPALDWYTTGRRTFIADAGKIGKTGPRTADRKLEYLRLTRDQLPQVWSMFEAGLIPYSQVAVVASEADGLDSDAAAAYDERCAQVLAGQPGSRLGRMVAAAREQAQARTADERHATARAGRNVQFGPGRDGMARLALEGPVEELAVIHQASHRAAVAAHGHESGRDCETRSIAALAYDVLNDLILDGFAITAAGIRDALLQINPDRAQRGQAVPQRSKVVPTVVVHVPALTLLGHSDELPTLDGVGPISPETAKRLCARAPSFFRVLTHPVTGARLTLDRTTYAPPADLRRWIHIRDEYSRFPGSLTSAHLSDIDHVQEWHDTGVTNENNVIALSRDKHLLKSMGLYTIDGDPNGELTFTSPMGLKHTSTPREYRSPVLRAAQAKATQPLPDECPF